MSEFAGVSADYFEVACNQRAHRALRPDPVPQELIERILTTATHAPSARNEQPWHFVVVQDAGVRQQIADAAKRAWLAFARDSTADKATRGFQDVDRWAMGGIADAPVMIVLCGDTQKTPHEQMGSSIFPAAQNILLAAAALGLGSLMSSLPLYAPGGGIGGILELPDHIVPYATLPIGYPARELGPPRREPIQQHTSRDRFGTPW